MPLHTLRYINFNDCLIEQFKVVNAISISQIPELKALTYFLFLHFIEIDLSHTSVFAIISKYILFLFKTPKLQTINYTFQIFCL